MQRVLKSCLLAAAILLGGADAWAGYQVGKIQRLHVRASDGVVWVILVGAPVGRPPCAVNQPYFMVMDENSNRGKQQLALLLMAQATGKSVQIDGRNTCTRWGDGEDIDVMSVLD
jgi:hypothetical protein